VWKSEEGEAGTRTQVVEDRRDQEEEDKLYYIVAEVAGQVTWGQA